VKPLALLTEPHGPETVTVFAPAEPAGVTALIFVELATVNEVAATPPIVTEVTPVRPDPLIAIGVPPAVGPALGTIVVIAGGTKQVKEFSRVAVPPGVVTDTDFGPAVSAGVTARIVDPFTTVTAVADFVPILTVLPLGKFAPTIVICVPPVVGPWFGVTEATIGGRK
jgi:hypothetical protein